MLGYPAVAADSMIFIYHLEDHHRYAPFTQWLLDLEILVKPLQKGDRQAAADYRNLLTTFPNLELVPVDAAVSARSASLRAGYGFKPPDAIQVATALVTDCPALLTNDRSLTRVEDIRVLILDDFV